MLTTLLGAPYVLGEGLLILAVALDGDDAVDALFEVPPRRRPAGRRARRPDRGRALGRRPAAHGGRLVFSSCDPGEAEGPDPPTDTVLRLPVARTVITSQVLEGGGVQEACARCCVNDLVDSLTLEQLTQSGTPDPALEEQVRDIALRCEPGRLTVSPSTDR